MKLFTFYGRIIFIFAVLFILLITGCESDSGSDDDLGDSWLKIAGGEYSMAKLHINNDGSVGGDFPDIYKHYITIVSENLDLDSKPPTGTGEYIYVTLFSTSETLPQDDYDFLSGDPEGGKFGCGDDAQILTDVVIADETSTVYEITGGTITINFEGTTYYISGDVTTDGGAASFRYVGPETY